MSPLENPSLGVGPAFPGPLHMVRNRGRGQTHPQVPRSFLGTGPQWGRENCWEAWPMGKCVALGVAGRPSVCRVKSQGHWEPGLISLGWGTLPGGRLVGGRMGVQAGPAIDPKPASPGSDKSHLLAASPLFFHP